MSTATLRSGFACALAFAAFACASNQFGRAIDSHNWLNASNALNADTSLLNDESTIFQAAMLYSFPNRPTYNPARARALFERLLKEHPTTGMRQAAVDQLSLLYEMQRVDETAAQRQQELLAHVASLEADTLRLRASIDSVGTRLRAEQEQSSVLRKVTSRLESDLQDRESQLNTLHSELDHLKAIDLRPVARPRSGDTALSTPRKPNP